VNIESTKIVCFSPTGTTKAVVQGVARGINPVSMQLIDVTNPAARKISLQTSENELLLVAVPVYMGRVPSIINELLNSIRAHNTPTVCIVVYGNRAYESALLELKNIVLNCGCIPIACAAYVGEHSFSNSELPIALGRPDEDDLKHAIVFGKKIREKINSISQIAQISDIYVPGSYPYGGVTKLWDVDFIEVSDQCSHCGVCAEVCPSGAVDSENSSTINIEKCITCCACIRNCPQNARTMKPGQVRDTAKRLNELYKEPKRPEYFL
jgi:ferredoxin